MIGKIEKQPRLTLDDIRFALEELKEERKSNLGYVEVLYELAKNKQTLAKKIAGNKEILKKFGDETEILKELDVLEKKYQDQIQTIEAGKSFGEKIEKQSWGKWAMEKVKSVVKFPVRHPIISLIILAAVAGGVAGYLGYLPAITGPLAEWMEKLKALMKGKFGFGAGEAGGEAINAVDAASKAAAEAANSSAFSLRTFGNQIGYGDKIYDLKDLPSLLKELPDIKDGQFIDVLRDGSSKAGIEVELKYLLEGRYGDAIKWGGGPPP